MRPGPGAGVFKCECSKRSWYNQLTCQNLPCYKFIINESQQSLSEWQDNLSAREWKERIADECPPKTVETLLSCYCEEIQLLYISKFVWTRRTVHSDAWSSLHFLISFSGSFWQIFTGCSSQKPGNIFGVDDVRAVGYEQPFSLNFATWLLYFCYHSILGLDRNSLIVFTDEIRWRDLSPSGRSWLVTQCTQSMGSKSSCASWESAIFQFRIFKEK